MKYVKYITLSVAASLIIGCGGGDDNSSSDTNSTTASEAFYIDSAIVGVDYKCGAQSGVTANDGKFKFVQGADCKFSLAGINLREVSKDDLSEGKKIVEDNVEVAQLLQSLDIDGNPDNGINITKEVVEALKIAVKDYNDTSKIITDKNIKEAVVAEVASQVESFKGGFKPIDKVKEHLEKTKSKIVKELLAGKTFYVYWSSSKEDKGVTKVTINSDATSWDYKDILGGSDSGKESLEVVGDTLKIKHQEDEEYDSYKVVNKGKYIALINTKDNTVLKFYSNEEMAKAEYNTKGSSSSKGSIDIKELIKGKTLYLVKANEDDLFIDKLVFDNNLSVVTVTEIEGEDKGESKDIKMHITDNKIFLDDTKDNKYFKISKENDEYYLMQEYEINGTMHGKPARVYLDESKAKEYFNSLTKEVTFNGKVIFKKDGNEVSIPQNAKIAIRPSQNKWNPEINFAIESDGTFNYKSRVPKNIFNEKFYLVVYGDTNNNNNWDGDSGEKNSDGVLENDVRYFEKELTFSELSTIEVNLSSN